MGKKKKSGRKRGCRTIEILIGENGELSVANAGTPEMPLIRQLGRRGNARAAFFCG